MHDVWLCRTHALPVSPRRRVHGRSSSARLVRIPCAVPLCLGVMLALPDRWTDAIESYRRALSNPLYATPDIAWFNLGLALAHEGDMEKAAQAFEDALRISPPNVQPAAIHLELGRAYYKLGYDTKAREELTRVSSLDKGGEYAAAAAKLIDRLRR